MVFNVVWEDKSKKGTLFSHEQKDEDVVPMSFFDMVDEDDSDEVRGRCVPSPQYEYEPQNKDSQKKYAAQEVVCTFPKKDRFKILFSFNF